MYLSLYEEEEISSIHILSLLCFLCTQDREGRRVIYIFSTPHLLPGRGHGTGDSQGPGLTISFSDEILVFSGNEISFRKFGKFRWILDEIC